MSFQYATGMCLLLQENVGGCEHAGRPEIVTLNICNWPVLFTATHILQEKTHACGVLKRHYFRVHFVDNNIAKRCNIQFHMFHNDYLLSLSRCSSKCTLLCFRSLNFQQNITLLLFKIIKIMTEFWRTKQIFKYRVQSCHYSRAKQLYWHCRSPDLI